MCNIRVNKRFLSMWMALVVVFAIFAGVPASAMEVGALSIGASNQLPAPGNPSWNSSNATASWGIVPNAGKDNEFGGGRRYYKWELYRLNTDRTISSASDLQESERVPGTQEKPFIFAVDTLSISLASFVNSDGIYYFTVTALGDGTNFYNSIPAVSGGFHYVKPVNKLPTPTNLRWQYLASENKYFGVWDNIFDTQYAGAQGFNVTCYNEAGEVYTHFFPMSELIQDRNTRNRPGTMLYMNNPNGIYRYKVQAISANLSVVQSGDWSALSPWVEVRPSSYRDSSSSNSSGEGGGSFGSGTVAAAASSSVKTSTQFKDLASTAKSKGEKTVTSRGTKEVTVKGSAWAQLTDLRFQHDTVANGAVQVRVTINNPTALTKDVKVSGYLTGKNATNLNNLIKKHFTNKTSVVHFDQAGSWGQEVRVALKLDLTGMNKDNLVFYSYDKANNTYSQIAKPNYSIDKSGYTHFSSSNAGDIIVSDGKLAKK